MGGRPERDTTVPSLNTGVHSSSLIEFLKFCYYVCMYVFIAVLGLCCCLQTFSSCSDQGLLFVEVRRLLIVVASLVAEQGL